MQLKLNRERNMIRSAHTLLWKNKRMAGMAIGAIAMVAMAVPALSQEGSRTDEVFTLTTAIQVPGATDVSFRLTSVGSIRCSTNTSWLTATTRRSTSSIRRTTASHNSSTRIRGLRWRQRHLRSRRRVDRQQPHRALGRRQPGEGLGTRIRDRGRKKIAERAANPISVGGTTRADELCYDSQNDVIMIASPAERSALRHLHLDTESLYSCWQTSV